MIYDFGVLAASQLISIFSPQKTRRSFSISLSTYFRPHSELFWTKWNIFYVIANRNNTKTWKYDFNIFSHPQTSMRKSKEFLEQQSYGEKKVNWTRIHNSREFHDERDKISTIFYASLQALICDYYRSGWQVNIWTGKSFAFTCNFRFYNFLF